MPRKQNAPAPVQSAAETDVVEALPMLRPEEITAESLIDRSQLRFDDLAIVSRMRRGAVGDEEVVAFMRRVCVGGAAGFQRVALGDMHLAFKALFEAVYGAPKAEHDPN